MAHDVITFQPSASYEEALSRAARAYRVELDYWDIFGNRHWATPDTLAAVVGSLGVDTSSQETLDRCLEQTLWSEWSRPLPPTLVALEGGSASERDSEEPASRIRICLPEQRSAETVELTFHWEDGSTRVEAANLQGLEHISHAILRGQGFDCWEMALPVSAPLGYHMVTLRLEGSELVAATMHLIVCPGRAWMPPLLAEGRAAGIAASLYGLRSERNWGCGDLTDLMKLTDWLVDELEGSFIALNPLHSIHNRTPYNTSPYSPNSIFYKNPIYLDIERIPDFQGSKWAARILAGPSVSRQIEVLRNSEFVEYERVYKLKLRFLKLLFRQFLKEYRQETARASEFRAWCEKEGELLDRFALYCALDEVLHRQRPDVWIWQDWPEPYRDPNSPETAEFAGAHWRLVLFYKYVQWQMHLQLTEAHRRSQEKGLAIGLYHDLALATDRSGGDLWAHREFYVPGCRVGSPPDDFSPNGQDWGFPPPNALRHREDGYRLIVESIRQNSRYGGALRIDHVMRFFRLYWIPDSSSAAHGTYVSDFYQDLVRILALESVRNRFLVVGEDLGTVPPMIRETLSRYGILSYRLFYFEKRHDGSFRAPEEYPRQALVSSTTHDLPTLAGFWTNRDIEARRAAGVLPDENSYHGQLATRRQEKQRMLDVLSDLGLLPEWHPRDADEVPELTGELHNAIIGYLASTPSMLLAINQEDLTKETEQQNLPGTTDRYPNWRRKMRFTLEELRTLRLARDCAAMVRHWLEQSGRRNPTGAR